MVAMKKIIISKLNAFELFPDVFKKKSKSGSTSKIWRGKQGIREARLKEQAVSGCRQCLIPPAPPDLQWLYNPSNETASGHPKPIPIALVVSECTNKQRAIVNELDLFHYDVHIAATCQEAMDTLAAREVALAIYDLSLGYDSFHHTVCWMDPSERRGLYYILVGSNVRTLYDLEALSLSANLVIHEDDLPYLGKILKKGLHDYEILFHPLINAMENTKKS